MSIRRRPPADPSDREAAAADALCSAIGRDDEEGFEAALRAGLGAGLAPGWIDRVGPGGHTPLGEAAREGSLDLVEKLLAAGAAADAPNAWGQRPLMLCCAASDERAHVDLARALLRAGADPNARNELGQTALAYCCSGCAGSAEAARELLRWGADPDIGDDEGTRPAHKAAKISDLALLAALAEGGASFDLRDDQGLTPAQAALQWSHPEAARACEAHDLARREKAEIGAATPKPKRRGKPARKSL